MTLPQRYVGFEVALVESYCRGIYQRSVLIFIGQALAVHAVDLPGLLHQRQGLAGFGVDVSALEHTVRFVVPHDEVVFLIEKGEVGRMVGRLIRLMEHISGVQQAADNDAALVEGQVVRCLVPPFVVAFFCEVAERGAGQLKKFEALQWVNCSSCLHILGHAR
ncbi:hypothetical protein NB04_21705 [Pseudomonas syringae pv. tomato]|nr:hypothetical protein NB04_21705 [Pseudomonas syringae pv. tomato]